MRILNSDQVADALAVPVNATMAARDALIAEIREAGGVAAEFTIAELEAKGIPGGKMKGSRRKDGVLRGPIARVRRHEENGTTYVLVVLAEAEAE